MANNETECSPNKLYLSDSNSELLIPTPWSDESNNEKRAKGRKKNSNRLDPCLRLTLRLALMPLIYRKARRKQSGDLVEMPSEAVEEGMDDHVPDEIDGAKGEQVPNHVGKKGNFEFLVCKQVANHDGDELVDKERQLNRKRVYAE
ncbi:hypothetical protein Tco_1129848 [Tanacetum coccineum]